MQKIFKNAEVIRDKNNRLHIAVDLFNKGAFNLYWGYTPVKECNGKTFIARVEENSITIDSPCDDRRIYFYIESDNGEGLVFAERTIALKGTNNFRDLGGYESRSGRRIKWGVLYRSDQFNKLDEKGIEYFNRLNIRSIIDFRSTSEIEKYPNKVTNVKVFNFDPSAQTAELAAQFVAKEEDENQDLINAIIKEVPEKDINGNGIKIIDQYRKFVSDDISVNAFRQFLNALAHEAVPPVIQHCRGGKDRTGYGTMLLLAMLDIPEETIIKDFLITAANREERNATKMVEYKKLTSSQNILDYLYSLIDTREDFIMASIHEMNAGYGSIKEYIMKKLEIDESVFNKMQELYLE